MRMLLDFFKTLGQKIEKANKCRRAVFELQSLNDRQLRDMGIYRCDIHRVACGDRCA